MQFRLQDTRMAPLNHPQRKPGVQTLRDIMGAWSSLPEGVRSKIADVFTGDGGDLPNIEPETIERMEIIDTGLNPDLLGMSIVTRGLNDYMELEPDFNNSDGVSGSTHDDSTATANTTYNNELDPNLLNMSEITSKEYELPTLDKLRDDPRLSEELLGNMWEV